jgi:CRISPR-associated exonuclease Cas4
MGTRHGYAADVQLCAQALCLEEMLSVQIEQGAIWFAGPRRREKVPIDEELRRRTAAAIQAVRSSFRTGALPIAVNDSRCDQCQLIDRCLPELTDLHGGDRIEAYLEREVRRCGS